MGKKSREDYMYEARSLRSENLEYEKRFNRVCKLITGKKDKLLNKILDILEGRK